MPSSDEARAAQAVSRMRSAAAEYLKVLERAEDASVDRDAWLEFAAELGTWSANLRDGLGEVNKSLGVTSGQKAILLYLLSRVGEPVPGDALAGVSGIYEWARRVRELRVESGWPIESGANRDDLDYDHYRLMADEPDEDLADRWRVAKEARNLKKPGGKDAAGRARLLHYLQAISPRPADKEQLAYVAKIHEWPRRLRELEEQGWQIVSNIDDPTLPPGSYRLPTLEMRPPRVREAIKLRYKILDRDKRTCQDCGRTPKEGVSLQIHHILPVHKGGQNDDENLITLCIQCHGGRHALMGTSAKDELLNPEYQVDLRD
ncbi:HNH endonuclease signature motif containing protein [Streptomyces sp. NPDC026673]|uniref:HNH endonuclease n=1 Tax=Streptomyces sp. NPDC026673 TaxID=3155724 RepID=UPI0033CEB21A